MPNNQQRLNTIDGASLMSKPFVPLPFIVDTLLSQGLHILAGAPKVGKSWLALQGTTLYLCLEDSQLRIQNRLLDITEDAPPTVHFCTEAALLGRGLEQRLEAFLTEHPDTVLVIIDTLQMIRGTNYENTYANDYRDLSLLKRLADAHGIAILLIHHLRKEPSEDVFSRISGTTAISGAVDSSFTLVEDRRGSKRAMLYCVGRDIEYREINLERNADNLWTVAADSYQRPELLGGRLIALLSAVLKDNPEFIGTPTELAKRIDPDGTEGVTPKTVSRKVLQSVDTLGELGITAIIRRSNGKRLIELHRAESAETQATGTVDPIDPGTQIGGADAHPWVRQA